MIILVAILNFFAAILNLCLRNPGLLIKLWSSFFDRNFVYPLKLNYIHSGGHFEFFWWPFQFFFG